MAAYENVRELSVVVQVTAGVAEVQKYRFAKWKVGGIDQQVEAATGVADDVAGVLSQRVPVAGVTTGVATFMSPAVSMAVADASIALVELGEAVAAIGADLRPGPNGLAYLADAAGDGIVGEALEVGAIGQIIRFQFKGQKRLVP
jgi:hypothetical protein